MEHIAQIQLDRRRFLQLSAAGLAVVSMPLIRELGSRRLALGALLPSGAGRDAMARELERGLGAGFAEAAPSIRPSLLTRGVAHGHGGARAALRELLAERPDAVVAAVTEPIAAHLAPIAREAGVPFVAANVGAHVPSGVVTSASLRAWEASYALGAWSVRSLGPRALVAVALREAGYDTVLAFRRGVEAAGGTVAATHVTHGAVAGLAELVRAIRATRPDHVHVAATGTAAVDVFRALGETRVPLTSGGLSVDERVLPALGRDALGVTSIAAWPGTTDAPGGPFEALGREASALVTAVIRGEAAASEGPLFLRHVERGPTGPRNATLETLPAGTVPADAMAGLDANRCAYVDEYPCP